MSSQRLVVQDKIVELLRTITKANGYNNDVLKVTKSFPDLEGTSSFPILGVTAGGVAFEWADETARDLIKNTASYLIVGLLEVKDDGGLALLNDAIDALTDDICECLLKNIDELNDAQTEGHLQLFHPLDPEYVDGRLSAYVSVVAVVWYHTENPDV